MTENIFVRANSFFTQCEKRKILSHWKVFSSNQLLLFSNFYSIKPLLSRNFCEKSERENFCNFHIVLYPHCRNYRNLLSHFFGKNFVKATHLLKSWFDGKTLMRVFSFFHTVLCYPHCVLAAVRKLWNFTATIFSRKYRESNFLLKNFTLNWFDGKKIAWHGSNFLVFLHEQFNSVSLKIFRQINLQ